jgi:hypothetical protein
MHQVLLCTLSLSLQKYNLSIPTPLTKVMMAFATLMNKANNATSQATPTIDVLTQKLGDQVEKSLQEEMEKMNSMVKSSLADQHSISDPLEFLTEAVCAIKRWHQT